MDLFDAIRARASVRSLEPVDIPADDLEAILDAGRRAPSGMNIQPLQFIAIRDRAMIDRLSKIQGFIAGASAIVAIVSDPGDSKYWLEDASAAAENMLLAIAALGYGSTWVEGTLSRREDWAKEQLDVPGHLRLIIMLPIGKPTGAVAQAAKNPLSEVVHHERFGQRG